MATISHKYVESIDAVQLKNALTGRILDVCFHLFPRGRKSGANFLVGNLFGEPGKSLSIVVTGAKAGTWCDFAEGSKGGPLDLWMQARDLTFREALREAAHWAGMYRGGVPLAPRREAKRVLAGLTIPTDATSGTPADWQELATLRHIQAESVCAATFLGTLFFGSVCGFPSWILSDPRRLAAEARRMDGKPFPASGNIGERKAHTLKGSVKNWPVGLVVTAHPPEDDAPFLVVEGGPDYLAALDFANREKPNVLAIGQVDRPLRGRW